MNGMLYVYKSMLNKLQNEWRSPLIFLLFITMTGALFFSRAVLSLSMIAFIAVSFFHPGIKKQFRNFFYTPLLWGISLLFLLPLVSGLWSEDQQQWLDILRIKLPLLVLPLAFAAPFSLSKKQWDWVVHFFIVVVLGATFWSMFHYVSDMDSINASYLEAKTMLTPLENDHVRFSWLVAVALLLSGYSAWQKRKDTGMEKWLLAIAMAWFILFLHLLAARTGVFSFYIMLAGLFFWFLLKKAKPVPAILALVVLVSLPIAAYFLLPSFQNRVNYFRYDLSYFKKDQYLPGSNDGVRFISIKAGWTLTNENPLTGVGFGDIEAKIKEQYAKQYPAMLETDKILPGSEWMIYGAGTGWPGLLLFSLVMLIPFFTTVKETLPWFLLNATAAFSFLFDIGLEVQFGVFIYAFILLLNWKRGIAEKM